MTWNHIIEVGSPEIRATITIRSWYHDEEFHLRTIRSWNHELASVSLPPEHEYLLDTAHAMAEDWLIASQAYCDDYAQGIL